jgi:uncharacterized protein
MGPQADLEANKAIVLSFWKAFSESRFADALGLLADNATWRVMGNTSISRTYSKTEFSALVYGIADSTVQGIQVKGTVLTAEGDRVAMEADSYGPMKSGKIYQNQYHFLHILRNGKIETVREYLDTEHVTDIFG